MPFIVLFAFFRLAVRFFQWLPRFRRVLRCRSALALAVRDYPPPVRRAGISQRNPARRSSCSLFGCLTVILRPFSACIGAVLPCIVLVYHFASVVTCAVCVLISFLSVLRAFFVAVECFPCSVFFVRFRAVLRVRPCRLGAVVLALVLC